MSQIKAIFIGASAGGVTAVQKLLLALKGDLLLPIVVVQHIPPNVKLNPNLIYKTNVQLYLQEVEEKTPLLNNHVYFAPPGFHLLIEKDHTFSLSQDAPVHHARPSIDVLFESAAIAYGSAVCGVILTGANQDGANGLAAIQGEGGMTIVQDPDEAETPFMPLSALEKIKPSFICSIEEIAQKISNLSMESLA